MRQLLFLTCALMTMAAMLGCGNKAEKSGNELEKKPIVTSPDENPIEYRHPIRDDANALVTLETNYGKMTLELYADVASAHADSFLARSTDNFYAGTIFHRIMDGFMIQGGDPTGTGSGNAGYYLDAEFSDLPHKEGTLSMARSPDINSASCQFFVCLGRRADLDGKYTVFGQLIKGYDVLRTLGKVETVMDSRGREKSRPKEEVKIIAAYRSDSEGNAL